MRYECVSCKQKYEFPALKAGVQALCPSCHADLREAGVVAGPSLIVQSGEGPSFPFFALSPGTTVGRDPGCEIVLPDETVSSTHARFFEQPDGNFGVSDCDSTNGTRVNGVRVVLHTLRDGDSVKFGSVSAEFRWTNAPPATASEVAVLHGASSGPIDAEYRPNSKGRVVTAVEPSEGGAGQSPRLERALEMTAELATLLEPAKLLSRLAEDVFELFGTERFTVLIRNSDRRTFSVALARSVNADKPDVFQLSRTVMRKVVDEKTALVTSDVLVDGRIVASGSLLAAGTRSALVAPLLHRDEVLGLVWSDTVSTTRTFTTADLRMFTGLVSVAAVTLVNARLCERVAMEANVRAHLSRYLAPEVVQSVMEKKLTLAMGGELCEATVLFSDIRGFTSASERMEPRQVVEMLNRYFEIMVDIVFRHGGTVCKFTGDGMMAVWGAPQPHSSHALSAVRAAIDMQRSMNAFNKASVALGTPEVAMGVGVHSGELVAGNIGSSRRMEFTVHGDTVNTAQRIEASTGPGDVFISRQTLERLDGRVPARPLPPIRVKNKAEPLALFQVDFAALARLSSA